MGSAASRSRMTFGSTEPKSRFRLTSLSGQSLALQYSSPSGTGTPAQQVRPEQQVAPPAQLSPSPEQPSSSRQSNWHAPLTHFSSAQLVPSAQSGHAPATGHWESSSQGYALHSGWFD